MTKTLTRRKREATPEKRKQMEQNMEKQFQILNNPIGIVRIEFYKKKKKKPKISKQMKEWNSLLNKQQHFVLFRKRKWKNKQKNPKSRELKQ